MEGNTVTRPAPAGESGWCWELSTYPSTPVCFLGATGPKKREPGERKSNGEPGEDVEKA